MLTKDIMAKKMGEDQKMKIDADTWQIHCMMLATQGPSIMESNYHWHSDEINQLQAHTLCNSVRDLRGTCDALACMCTCRSKDLRVSSDFKITFPSIEQTDKRALLNLLRKKFP